MAKQSWLAREVKRRKLVGQYAEIRAELRKRVLNRQLPEEERWLAMMTLQKLPRDSSRSRQRNRCAITGRPRGYFRHFGLARNALREVIMRGEAPGVVKASW